MKLSPVKPGFWIIWGGSASSMESILWIRGEPSEDGVVYGDGWEESVFERLKERGMNLIRLGVTWDALEPVPGRYREHTFAMLEKTFAACERNGIYVMLEIHQDLYSALCYGNGAPPWACVTDGNEPEDKVFVWAEGYFFSAAVHACFDHFWANDPVEGKGLQDRFADVWMRLAKRFGSHPALLGYDVFNEPFPGSPGGECFWELVRAALRVISEKTGKEMQPADLLAYLSEGEKLGELLCLLNDKQTYRAILSDALPFIREFDVTQYSPFLTRVAKEIRGVAPRGVLFLENCYYSNLGIPCSVLPVTDGDGEREPLSAFSPHGYDLVVDTQASGSTSNERVDVIFEEHRHTQERLKLPVLVGEWGGMGGGDSPLSLEHARHIRDGFSRNRWSDAYWCYGKSLLDSPMMDVLSEPYPQAVTGEILSYNYDRESRVFTLEYRQDRDYAGPTLVYVPSQPLAVETRGTWEKQPLGKSGVLLRISTGRGTQQVAVRL